MQNSSDWPIADQERQEFMAQCANNETPDWINEEIVKKDNNELSLKMVREVAY